MVARMSLERTAFCCVLSTWVFLAGLEGVAAQNNTVNMILARSWSGAGWPEGSESGASYIYRPMESMSYSECLPRTGRPSACPAEMMSLILLNQPPADSEPGLLNFTMMIHGDVFTSSPNAKNYYGMPEECSYTHNHTVEARFNMSSGRVSFTILRTTSDFLECGMKLSGTGDDVQTAPKERCVPVGNCHTTLIGLQFIGRFTIKDSTESTAFKFPDGSVEGIDVTPEYTMDITLAFPYQHAGIGSWSDFATQFASQIVVPQVAAQAEVTQMGTDTQQQVFRYTLAPRLPYPYRPYEWFRDRKPYIMESNPPFGPEEGGPVITVRGVEFPAADDNFQNASLVLFHTQGAGGQDRECCETRRISDTEMTCVLPRVSCRNEKSTVNDCPKPGADFTNQSIKLAIRPDVLGFDGLTPQNDLDDFLSYEGTWILEDNDIFGGEFVISADRIPGETHILQQGQDTASTQHCCPVCSAAVLGDDPSAATQCHIIIERDSDSVYKATIPSFMNPGNPNIPGQSGACDPATNYENTTLTLAIETSTQEGFLSASPLSITNCMAMTGACAEEGTERVSIRTFCKQLVWSNGLINSFIPAGETVERHEWKTSGSCDRRMRCVAGKCLWTNLAQKHEVFQRRSSTPKLTLEIDYRNPRFQPEGFLRALGPLIDAEDTRRLQILEFTTDNGAVVPRDIRPEPFVQSQPALCIPDEGDPNAIPPREAQTACSSFIVSIYIVSGGPSEGSPASVPLLNFTQRAGEKTGDPEFRQLNLLRLCIDLSGDPASVTENILIDCIKIQYPGFLQFEILPGVAKDRRVREAVWEFASLGVTRTGGTDLGVTVDYSTYENNDPEILNDPLLNAEITDEVHVAKGLGEDFFSKEGQLRWTPGDAGTKYIIIPIFDDDQPELEEMFKVRISNVVNASMEFATETATVTIVGGPLNDTPTPRYIENMQRIIGAVCGAATTIPCALFAARLIRSLRRGKDTKKRKQHAAPAAAEKADDQ